MAQRWGRFQCPSRSFQPLTHQCHRSAASADLAPPGPSSFRTSGQAGGNKHRACCGRCNGLVQTSGRVAIRPRHGIVRHDTKPDLVRDKHHRAVETAEGIDQPGRLRLRHRVRQSSGCSPTRSGNRPEPGDRGCFPAPVLPRGRAALQPYASTGHGRRGGGRCVRPSHHRGPRRWRYRPAGPARLAPSLHQARFCPNARPPAPESPVAVARPTRGEAAGRRECCRAAQP